MNPWDQLESETSLAYKAFMAYLELGPSRSIDEAYRRDREKPEAKQASGHFNAWAQENRWFDRAQAWDAHDLAEKLKTRDTVREQVRQVLTDAAIEVAISLKEIALGQTFPDKGRVKAICELLDRVGVIKPSDTQRLELSGPGGSPIRTENADVQALLEQLSDDELAALEAIADRAESPGADPG